MSRLDPDKPIFKTRDLADILGVTTNYVRDQVIAGALTATVKRKHNSRTLYRFSLNDVLTYDRDAARRLERKSASA
jgi:hypothetical protein